MPAKKATPKKKKATKAPSAKAKSKKAAPAPAPVGPTPHELRVVWESAQRDTAVAIRALNRAKGSIVTKAQTAALVAEANEHLQACRDAENAAYLAFKEAR